LRIFKTKWFARYARRERVADRAKRLRVQERENISPDELLTLREIGASWLSADAEQIACALDEAALQEVTGDQKSTA
jgi:hypothetical protein